MHKVFEENKCPRGVLSLSPTIALPVFTPGIPMACKERMPSAEGRVQRWFARQPRPHPPRCLSDLDPHALGFGAEFRISDWGSPPKRLGASRASRNPSQFPVRRPSLGRRRSSWVSCHVFRSRTAEGRGHPNDARAPPGAAERGPPAGSSLGCLSAALLGVRRALQT